MTLVDTSVWVDHLRRHDHALARLLLDGVVVCHPFVAGEIALGRLRDPATTLALLADLPQVQPASHEEVLEFISIHQLAGIGIGWVDAHLLCASAIGQLTIWTRDRRLRDCAGELGLAIA
jgi:predicted nucleic acid-binding protein